MLIVSISPYRLEMSKYFCLENTKVARKFPQYIEVELLWVYFEAHSFSWFGIIRVEMYAFSSTWNTVSPFISTWYQRSIMTIMNLNWRSVINSSVKDCRTQNLFSACNFFHYAVGYILGKLPWPYLHLNKSRYGRLSIISRAPGPTARPFSAPFLVITSESNY